jgi:hypothetical protein
MFALIAAALAVTGVSAGADARHVRAGGRCARSGSVTLMQTRLIRVYRNKRQIDTSAVYACYRRDGRATLLGTTLGQSLEQYAGVRATAIRGSLLAFGVVEDPDSDDGPPGTVVVRVRMPFAGRSAAATGPRVDALAAEPFDPNSHAPAIERMLIAPNGTIVFTACPPWNAPDQCRRPLTDTRVIAATSHALAPIPHVGTNKPIELDRGAAIDPRSPHLSPSGTRLAWTSGGQKRTAAVPSD